MRVIAMILFVLALAKIGLMQHLREAGAREVIVAAYGAQAIRACEAADASLKLVRVAPATIDMVIGDRAEAIALWQVDHAGWVGRFRRVYLDVGPSGGAATCRFDIAASAARHLSIRP